MDLSPFEMQCNGRHDDKPVNEDHVEYLCPSIRRQVHRARQAATLARATYAADLLGRQTGLCKVLRWADGRHDK